MRHSASSSKQTNPDHPTSPTENVISRSPTEAAMRKLVIVAALLSGIAVTPAKADILAASSRASQTQVSDGLPLPVFETGTTNLSFKMIRARQVASFVGDDKTCPIVDPPTMV